jgi:16S rRNA (guanine966-N2)-methyltransferase
MTRIIGGVAGSRKLAGPAKSTRPTSDRIRESIFNRLEARDLIDGSAVLDLYAGTGALALEAISRGASSSVMIELNSQAAEICQKNSALVLQAFANKSEDQIPLAKVINKSVKVALSDGSALVAFAKQKFDLVFIDPPYEISNYEITETLISLHPVLNEDATIAVERSSRSETFDVPEGYELDSTKDYGDTVVYWLTNF